MNHASNQPTFAPRNNGPKNLLILIGIFGGIILLGLTAVALIFYFLYGSTNHALTSYLDDKYGHAVSFTKTGNYGGGDLSKYYITYYTTNELDGKQFAVKYTKTDGKINSICDNYMQVKYADQVEELFTTIFTNLGYSQFRVIADTSSSCVNSTPTDNFDDYIHDPKSHILVTVAIQDNPAHPVDKATLSNNLISQLQTLHLSKESSAFNDTFANVIVVGDDCLYTENVYTCPITSYVEDFWISPEGYEERKIPQMAN